MKRPINQTYDILINPYSTPIEEKDFGIFLINSEENLIKLWKNECEPERQNSNLPDFFSQTPCVFSDLFQKKQITNFKSMKSKLSGHIIVKSSPELFRLFVKAIRDHSNKPIVLAEDFDLSDEDFPEQNQVFFFRTCWNNEEEIMRLGLEDADYLALFSQTEDCNSDGENLRVIDYVEKNCPDLKYIA